jgi:hypothetical protein
VQGRGGLESAVHERPVKEGHGTPNLGTRKHKGHSSIRSRGQLRSGDTRLVTAIKARKVGTPTTVQVSHAVRRPDGGAWNTVQMENNTGLARLANLETTKCA